VGWLAIVLGALILVTVATLAVLAGGAVSSESAQPSSSVAHTPLASSNPNSTANPNNTANPNSSEQDQTQLPQALGSLVFLLTKQHVQSGNYPTTLVADSGGLVTVESGSVRLPTGSTLSYVLKADGSGFQLAITGASGLIAHYDSSVGTISVG
jgi:hypothetical protein